MQIEDIEGKDIIKYSSIKNEYNGKNSDSCKIKEIFEIAKPIIGTLNKAIDFPNKNEIIVIYAKEPQPKIHVKWSDGGENDLEAAAFTFSRKRKIILTNPLPQELDSAQVFLHELGHWCFDRYFDEIMENIPRDGFEYLKHSEAMALYFEEKIIKRNCKKMPKDTGMHQDACYYLRDLEKKIPQEIIEDFKEKWNNKKNDDCP